MKAKIKHRSVADSLVSLKRTEVVKEDQKGVTLERAHQTF
jgi:hypothetical protein